MNRFLYFLLLFSFNVFAEVNFISPSVQEIKFTIDEGIVFTNGNENPRSAIIEQLKYMFGILNEVDAGIDFPQLKIDFVSAEKGEIHYKVNGTIAWSKARALPRSFVFLLPKGNLTEFLNKYQKNCARKPSVLASFWNYYHPHNPGCVIEDGDVVKIVARFNPEISGEENLLPNYFEIFKDNTLEMTVIMTKDHPLEVNDVSVTELQTLCPNLSGRECHRESFQGGVRVVLHVFLLDNFDDKPQDFLTRIQSYLVNSDVVTYNGHSGMGANIESWMKYYPVKDKEKYQIIFLNSCDTFGYFKNEFLNEGNRQVILNATPNYFGTFANSNRNIINKILENADFNEILLSLPIEQHPLVLSK